MQPRGGETIRPTNKAAERGVYGCFRRCSVRSRLKRITFEHSEKILETVGYGLLPFSFFSGGFCIECSILFVQRILSAPGQIIGIVIFRYIDPLQDCEYLLHLCPVKLIAAAVGKDSELFGAVDRYQFPVIFHGNGERQGSWSIITEQRRLPDKFAIVAY